MITEEDVATARTVLKLVERRFRERYQAVQKTRPYRGWRAVDELNAYQFSGPLFDEHGDATFYATDDDGNDVIELLPKWWILCSDDSFADRLETHCDELRALEAEKERAAAEAQAAEKAIIEKLQANRAAKDRLELRRLAKAYPDVIAKIVGK